MTARRRWGQDDKCSIAATARGRSANRFSSARRLLRSHIVHVHHHAVEERIHLRAQQRQAAEHADVVVVVQGFVGIAQRRYRVGQRAFNRVVEQAAVDGVGNLTSAFFRMLLMRLLAAASAASGKVANWPMASRRVSKS